MGWTATAYPPHQLEKALCPGLPHPSVRAATTGNLRACGALALRVPSGSTPVRRPDNAAMTLTGKRRQPNICAIISSANAAARQQWLGTSYRSGSVPICAWCDQTGARAAMLATPRTPMPRGAERIFPTMTGGWVEVRALAPGTAAPPSRKTGPKNLGVVHADQTSAASKTASFSRRGEGASRRGGLGGRFHGFSSA